jgi:hypothetical protein
LSRIGYYVVHLIDELELESLADEALFEQVLNIPANLNSDFVFNILIQLQINNTFKKEYSITVVKGEDDKSISFCHDMNAWV